MRCNGIGFGPCRPLFICLHTNKPIQGQRYIPHRHNQPPGQDKPIDDTADNEVQRKQGNPATQGASTWYKPKPHPMEAEGQSAEYPKPQIINCSILHTGGFEDANQQDRPSHGYYALSEKLKDRFFSCHGISPPGIHYNSCGFKRR